mmetsp:Transcript_17662/g.26587  ORF Transcript_17662/g.26587 Transcript_17662/m.26587 type:complete len:104 (+) Transcript_17662:708-1019(+)
MMLSHVGYRRGNVERDADDVTTEDRNGVSNYYYHNAYQSKQTKTPSEQQEQCNKFSTQSYNKAFLFAPKSKTDGLHRRQCGHKSTITAPPLTIQMSLPHERST